MINISSYDADHNSIKILVTSELYARHFSAGCQTIHVIKNVTETYLSWSCEITSVVQQSCMLARKDNFKMKIQDKISFQPLLDLCSLYPAILHNIKLNKTNIQQILI